MDLTGLNELSTFNEYSLSSPTRYKFSEPIALIRVHFKTEYLKKIINKSSSSTTTPATTTTANTTGWNPKRATTSTTLESNKHIRTANLRCYKSTSIQLIFEYDRTIALPQLQPDIELDLLALYSVEFCDGQ